VTRIGTRAKNADTHPGLVEVPKRKRRTKAQIAADKKAEEEAEEAKAQAARAALQKLADVEDRLNNNSANDVTPRPNPGARSTYGRTLRRTSSYAIIPLGGGGATNQAIDDATDWNPTESEFQELTDVPDRTDTEDDEVKQPLKKKTKVATRDAVEDIRKTSASRPMVNERLDTTHLDKASDKRSHQARGAFPSMYVAFSPLSNPCQRSTKISC
jgi:hypothetical protein